MYIKEFYSPQLERWIIQQSRIFSTNFKKHLGFSLVREMLRNFIGFLEDWVLEIRGKSKPRIDWCIFHMIICKTKNFTITKTFNANKIKTQ